MQCIGGNAASLKLLVFFRYVCYPSNGLNDQGLEVFLERVMSYCDAETGSPA